MSREKCFFTLTYPLLLLSAHGIKVKLLCCCPRSSMNWPQPIFLIYLSVHVFWPIIADFPSRSDAQICPTLVVVPSRNALFFLPCLSMFGSSFAIQKNPSILFFLLCFHIPVVPKVWSLTRSKAATCLIWKFLDPTIDSLKTWNAGMGGGTICSWTNLIGDCHAH